MTRLVVGSRASKLAITQTQLIIQKLQALIPNIDIEVNEITTQGDQLLDADLPAIGGKGVFIKEIEEALLRHEIDFAVHSLKDMPTDVMAGLKFAAIPTRADARDVLISREKLTLDNLPSGAVVGTGSPRRACQLLSHRSDLGVKGIRGNVDSRLRKLQEGQYDAILLASAGLERLHMLEIVSEYLEPGVMLPAVGQGALAVQVRSEDSAVEGLIAHLNDKSAQITTTAERAFLSAMGGGCSAPITAYAQLVDNKIEIAGMAALPDGSELIRAEMVGNIGDAEQLGRELAKRLLGNGADKIIQLLRDEA